jgi:hypothetical protein
VPINQREIPMKICITLGVLFLLMVLPAGGDLYIWTDANGVKHFSNEPPPIQEDVEQHSEIKHSSEQYDRWEDQRRTDQRKMVDDHQPGEDAKEKANSPNGWAMGRHENVVMCTKPSCGYCAQARAFFKKHAVPYIEYDITADKQARERYKKLNGNGVPLI